MVCKRRRRYFSIALLILLLLAIQLWNIWLHKQISGGGSKSLHGSSYCTHSPNLKCFKNGWPSCCSEPPSYWNANPCPKIKPACDDDIVVATTLDVMPQSYVEVTNNNKVHHHTPQTSLPHLPNILLVGAQKAGTSAVASWLFNNGICRSLNGKEVHFFDHKEKYKLGSDYYIKQFQHCNMGGLSMDATPNTLIFPEKVHKTYTEVYNASSTPSHEEQLQRLKIIVILREPISRQLSRYNHMKLLYIKGSSKEWVKEVAYNANNSSNHNRTREVMPFDTYVEKIISDHNNNGRRSKSKYPKEFKPSMYVDHIKTWSKLFGRDKILILSYDELKDNPNKVQQRIETFLNIKLKGQMERKNQKITKHKVDVISDKALQLLVPLFQTKNEELYQFLQDNPGPSSMEGQYEWFKIVMDKRWYNMVTMKDRDMTVMRNKECRYNISKGGFPTNITKGCYTLLLKHHDD